MRFSTVFNGILVSAVLLIFAFLPSRSNGQDISGVDYRFRLAAGSDVLFEYYDLPGAFGEVDTTVIAVPGKNYQIFVYVTVGASTRVTGSPRNLSMRIRNTVNFVTSSPPNFSPNTEEAHMTNYASAQVTSGFGWGGELYGNGSSIPVDEPFNYEGSGSAEASNSTHRAGARLFLSTTNTGWAINVEGLSQVSVSGGGSNNNDARAHTNYMRVIYFSVGDTTTIIARASLDADDCGAGASVVGLSVCNPVFPLNTTPPYVFPQIFSGYWIDPPTTYGYRYELDDALITAVTGWSPHTDGPVRVSVGAVDLGLFDQSDNLAFSDYSAELGGLLIGGSGVNSFEVTEITPRTYEGDPLAFPIQIQYSEPSTSTLVMTPIIEPEVSAVESESAIPWATVAASASPNPFNPAVSVQYSIPQSARVSVSVYDLQGKVVRNLVSGVQQSAGQHSLTWRGDDQIGRALASGVYIVRINAGEQQGTVRVTLIK